MGASFEDGIEMIVKISKVRSPAITIPLFVIPDTTLFYLLAFWFEISNKKRGYLHNHTIVSPVHHTWSDLRQNPDSRFLVQCHSIEEAHSSLLRNSKAEIGNLFVAWRGFFPID